MAEWTKDAAIVRMQANRRLAHVIAMEPSIQPIIDAAIQQENGPGYNRILRYYELRDRAIPLVGFEARVRGLRTTEDYDAVILTIGDLLPPDDVDLYPEGKDVQP